MNTTSKTLIAVAIALNIAAITAVTGMLLQQRSKSNTVDLGSIVVTPTNSDAGRVNLGTILVTPSDADWRYAEARGVQRPAMKTIALGTIVVEPTTAQLADLADAMLTSDASMTVSATAADAASASLFESLESFTPGKYLNAGATLQVLNALVFAHAGS